MTTPFYTYIRKNHKDNPRLQSLLSYMKKSKVFSPSELSAIAGQSSKLKEDLKLAQKEYNNHRVMECKNRGHYVYEYSRDGGMSCKNCDEIFFIYD